MTHDLTVTANHILCAIPSRYKQREPGLVIHQLAGEDAMQELDYRIRNGLPLQLETESDTSIQNLVRVGQVLAVAERLDDQMVLCAAGDQVRTYADITPVVKVGDQVYLDWACLTDENEILPGVYRVSYGAVICALWDCFGEEQLMPVGGYVLLSRVWADDVEEAEVEGRMRKVRWNATRTLIAEYDVPPLPNEGIVEFVDVPLKGALNELHPGQRVLIAPGHALVETIAGESYLCVRHDYILAKQVSLIEEMAPLVEATTSEWAKLEAAIEKAMADNKPAYDQLTRDAVEFGLSICHASPDGKLTRLHPLSQNPFTKDFQRLPLNHPSYLA